MPAEVRSSVRLGAPQARRQSRVCWHRAGGSTAAAQRAPPPHAGELLHPCRPHGLLRLFHASLQEPDFTRGGRRPGSGCGGGLAGADVASHSSEARGQGCHGLGASRELSPAPCRPQRPQRWKQQDRQGASSWCVTMAQVTSLTGAPPGSNPPPPAGTEAWDGTGGVMPAAPAGLARDAGHGLYMDLLRSARGCVPGCRLQIRACIPPPSLHPLPPRISPLPRGWPAACASSSTARRSSSKHCQRHTNSERRAARLLQRMASAASVAPAASAAAAAIAAAGVSPQSQAAGWAGALPPPCATSSAASAASMLADSADSRSSLAASSLRRRCSSAAAADAAGGTSACPAGSPALLLACFSSSCCSGARMFRPAGRRRVVKHHLLAWHHAAVAAAPGSRPSLPPWRASRRVERRAVGSSATADQTLLQAHQVNSGARASAVVRVRRGASRTRRTAAVNS